MELLATTAGADAIAQSMEQADAAILRNYLLLLTWECEDRECAWRIGASPEPPPVVLAAVMRALGEVSSPRARACLEYCEYSKTPLPEAFPVASLVFDEFMAEGSTNLDTKICMAAIDIATREPDRLSNLQVQSLLTAAADFGSPRSRVIGFLGRLDTAVSGPTLIAAMNSDLPQIRSSAFQTLHYRYYPTQRQPEPFERDFAMTVAGRLLDRDKAPLTAPERLWIGYAATGMPTREFAYPILDALAATESDADRRAALQDLAAGMAGGRDRGDLQRDVVKIHW